MSAPKVLLVWRMPGTRKHLLPAARHLCESGCEVIVVTQSGRPEAIKGVRCLFVDEDTLWPELVAEARSICVTLKPDLVISGISPHGQRGIDEAFWQVGEATCLAFQDYWGATNIQDGLDEPEGYLVLDEEAQNLTRGASERPVIVLGSPAHADYSAWKVEKARYSSRYRLLPPGGPKSGVVTFFGQPLWRFPGYAKMLYGVAEALPEDMIARYRPHPLEGAQAGKLPFPLVPVEEPLEDSILASDAVLTMYSTCYYDAMHMLRLSDHPLFSLLSLYIDEDIKTALRFDIPSALPPFVALAGRCVTTYEQVAEAIHYALTPAARNEAYQAVRRSLPDPAGCLTGLANLVRRLCMVERRVRLQNKDLVLI